MELPDEEGKAALRIGHDQMLMRAHERNGVYENAEPRGAHGERVEVELTDDRVGSKQVMAAKGAAWDHHGVAPEHEAWLGHGQGWSTNQAVVSASEFNAFRQRDGRISSNPVTGANLGEVAVCCCRQPG